MLDNNLRQRIIDTLARAQTASLASIDDFGYPIIKTMLITSHKGLDEIWFSTARSTDKVGRIQKNPKVGAHFLTSETQISLIGEAEVRDDFIARHINWNDNLLQRYPLGPSDPDYVLICFKPHYASIMDQGIQTNGEV